MTGPVPMLRALDEAPVNKRYLILMAAVMIGASGRSVGSAARLMRTTLAAVIFPRERVGGLLWLTYTEKLSASGASARGL